MKYISIGAVNKPSTEHIVYVSHYGYNYTLTGDLAFVWLNGRFCFGETSDTFREKALRQLDRMGLVILAENVPEGALTRVKLVPAKTKRPDYGLTESEKNALIWISESGLVLSMAELVYLMEHNIHPEMQYLGRENVQRLVERIYTNDTIFDNILENQMEHASCRDKAVRTVLKLLKKKRIVLL